MEKQKKIGLVFPGQGAQYVGMCKDFYDHYTIARQTFEEANDLLDRDLASIVFDGPETLLTETKNSQLGIYVASVAILRVVQSLFPQITPSVCAGLSLGEYSALTAAGKLSFIDGISIVRHRGQFMNDACEATHGTMAVVLGLNGDEVASLVQDLNLPDDLWVANYNCPGQVVISGTLKGIEAGTVAAKASGAKRVLPLQVHGAFHSGLMAMAEKLLTSYLIEVPLQETSCDIVMNVTGSIAKSIVEIRGNLIEQVTHSVRWEQSIHSMIDRDVSTFIELGCGKTISGFLKRIGVTVPFTNVDKIEDLKSLEGVV